MIGDEFAPYKVRILDKLKQIKNEIEEDNLYAFKEQCEEVMSGILEEIEHSIEEGKISSIESLANEFKNIEVKYSANFPNILQKKEIWFS